MSEGSEVAGSKRVAAAGAADRLSALPDELLQHVLSFLQSKDAVQTCVLARRWRHQWKDVPALRVSLALANSYWGASALNKFLNYFIFLRNRSPLEEVEINAFESEDFDECVEYSLSLNVRKLSITSNDVEERWSLPKGLIASGHYLKTLELTRVRSDYDLDFSTCASLEDLKCEFCTINCGVVVSPSMKNLSIVTCTFPDDARTQISTPLLISLLIVDCWGRTPLLDKMPQLVKAFVRLQHCCDYCENSYDADGCGAESCEGCRDSKCAKNVLLEGLSSSTSLELLAAPTSFIFRRDLALSPIFSNLRTLLLNEWCMTSKFGPLICLLHHAPVLKKLILQIPKGHGSLVDMGTTYELKQPLQLKDITVEIKCDEVEGHISKLVEALVSNGVHPEKIEIRYLPLLTEFRFDDTWPSGSFSFEQRAGGNGWSETGQGA